MAEKVGAWALDINGGISWCTAPPEKRGMRRCNHVAHQEGGESLPDFMTRAENIHIQNEGDGLSNAKFIKVDFHYDMEEHKRIVDSMPDYEESIKKIVSDYGLDKKNPNWQQVILDIENPFHIGSKKDGTYEEAEMVDFIQQLSEDGKSFRLTAKYLFRGKEYELSYGEVPAVLEDGTIDIDGNRWRVLPVLEQRNAGVVSYMENVVVKQKRGDIAMLVSKDPSVNTVKVLGQNVSKSAVMQYLQTGESEHLTGAQQLALDNIDPMAFERFPNLTSDIDQLIDLPVDEVGDITWRKVIRYQDMVSKEMAKVLKRAGDTFRLNLGRRQELTVDGDEYVWLVGRGNNKKEMRCKIGEIDQYMPLFYQTSITENVKKDLIGRSNVQNAENLNPISALTQAQKVSLTGPGGFNKDKAPNDLRMPHPSHEGIIDPLVASSGKNVGLTACVTNGYVDDHGFIKMKQEGESSLSVSDFIPYKHYDDPSRANMACAHLTQAVPITGGEDPLVSTEAWDRIKGSKLGTNLKVAYTADKDCFEDGVVISKSAAKRMATVQTQKYQSYNPVELGKLKVGQRVERKDMVGDTEIKYGGVVKSISDDGFEVETVYHMGVGDKLSNRHGGKSVVARVRDDKDMPHIFNETTGKMEPADIVMSPESVVNRKNLAQIMECNQAAEMTGLHSKSDNPTNIDRTSFVVANGHRVEATAGVEYIMRLNHISEKVLSSHADELDSDRQAAGVRLGEMESILLSTDKDRLTILKHLRHQVAYDSHRKLQHLLKSIGVDMSGVNWDA